MSSFSLNPAYNLKAVLKNTGIKPDVLRAWERRYGLPLPQRTPGGHRLYSQHDIELIKWLLARQVEGLRISRAIELWKEQSHSGSDPLDPAEVVSKSSSGAVLSTSMDGLRQAWLAACMAFNESSAEQTLNQAFSLYPVEMVCTDLIQAGLRQVGEAWFNGSISVHQEHFTSALATRQLEAIIEASPRPTRNQTILLACPAGEWHTFSPLLLTLLLRRAGYDVVNLGANVPLAHITSAIDAVRPDLVILTAQQLTTVVTLRQMAVTLRDMKVFTAYGGQIFNRLPAVQNVIPAFYLGSSIPGVIEQVDQIINWTKTSPINPPGSRGLTFGAMVPVVRSEAVRALAPIFREQRRKIELNLYDQLKLQNGSFDALETATTYLGDELAAALDLGNPDYLTPDISWVRALIINNHLPASILVDFLRAYRQSVSQGLGEKAALILAWFDRLLDGENSGFYNQVF